MPAPYARRYLAIPRTVRVDQRDPGAWGSVRSAAHHPPRRRRLHARSLTRCEEPDAFGYEITGLRGPLSLLVDRIAGTYAFAKAGTRVTWSWLLHTKGGLGATVMPVFGRMWAGYARQALGQLERSLV